MRFGGWAKALEAAIDKNLGIDTEEANKTIEAANAVEGSLLDTDLAKSAKERLKGTTEKLGAVVGNVRDQVEKTVNRTGPKATPTPDDFFADFGFLEAKKNPTQRGTKQSAILDQHRQGAKEDNSEAEDGGTIAASSNTTTSPNAASSLEAAFSSEKTDKTRQPTVNSTPPQETRGESAACAPRGKQTREHVQNASEEQKQATQEQDEMPAEAAGWDDVDDLDDALLGVGVSDQPPPEHSEAVVSNTMFETKPHAESAPVAKTVMTPAIEDMEASKSAGGDDAAVEEILATRPPAASHDVVSGESVPEAEDQPQQAIAGAGAIVETARNDREQEVVPAEAAGALVEEPRAIEEEESELTTQAAEEQAERCAGEGGKDMKGEREREPGTEERETEEYRAGEGRDRGSGKGEGHPKAMTGEEGRGAGGGGGAGQDEAGMRVLREEARQWRMAAERWEAEAERGRAEAKRREEALKEREREVEQLKVALAKSGKMMQDITLENEEKCQGLEFKIQQEKEVRARLEAENATLRKANSSSTALQDRLTELEEEKQGLFKEGERLMVEKQNLENGIRQCRKHIKEKEEELAKVKEQKTSEETKVMQLEEKLAMAGESKLSTEESIAQIRAISQETTKKLQTCEKEKSALSMRVEVLERAGEELQRERDDAERRASKAAAEAEAEAKRTLERERKGMQKDSSLQMEALSDSLDAAQQALKRAEAQFAAKEQRLKQEISDLTERCAETEARCQELSSAVPQSTRPLLRQLENLQQSFAEKQKVWEQVEASLRQRTSQAETEAREATERERTAGEQAKQVQDAMGGMEARVKTLQAEKARLGAELVAAKEELEEVKRREEELSQQTVTLKASATKKAQEVADLKALQRRLQMEEKDRMEKEHEAWEVEREELLGRIKQLQSAVKEAEKTKQQQSTRPDSAEWGDVNIFGGGGGSNGGGAAWAGGERDVVGSAWDLHSTGPSVFGGAPGRNQDSQVQTLQQRVRALEKERDAVADELARASVRAGQQQSEARRAQELTEEVAALRKQLELSLELLGAKEEEVDDLRETMEEQKQVFQRQLDALLPQ